MRNQIEAANRLKLRAAAAMPTKKKRGKNQQATLLTEICFYDGTRYISLFPRSPW